MGVRSAQGYLESLRRRRRPARLLTLMNAHVVSARLHVLALELLQLSKQRVSDQRNQNRFNEPFAGSLFQPCGLIPAWLKL